MGKQIAALFYIGGCNIHVFSKNEVDRKSFNRQLKLLKKTYKGDCVGEINFYKDISELPDALTIECISENIDDKKKLYELYMKGRDGGAPYFSNTSSISPYEIGRDVKGLHFFNPINLNLVEVCCLTRAKDDRTSELFKLLERFNFKIVFVEQNRGYIGNYILFHEISTALKLIEKYGYSVDNITNVYDTLYGGRNIFLIVDLIGIDVVSNILDNLKADDDSIYLPESLALALNENILGKKNKTSIVTVLERFSGDALDA